VAVCVKFRPVALYDVQKVHAIIAMRKRLDDPAVSEGALYASNVLNGKKYAAQGRQGQICGRNFGILEVVAVVG